MQVSLVEGGGKYSGGLGCDAAAAAASSSNAREAANEVESSGMAVAVTGGLSSSIGA
jgi:3-keto-L-gulonate-6-phosphate decarboxylase